MANLIITVISIALVAVAALMGAYYGGSAFMEGQTKAHANLIISQSEQIASALNMWMAENGISTSALVINSTPTFLVPKYLSTAPTEFSSLLGSYASINFRNAGTTWFVSSYTTVAEKKAIDICNQLTKLSMGLGSVPVTRASVYAGAGGRLVNGTYPKFDCLYDDTNSSGQFDIGDLMFISYLAIK